MSDIGIFTLRVKDAEYREYEQINAWLTNGRIIGRRDYGLTVKSLVTAIRVFVVKS